MAASTAWARWETRTDSVVEVAASISIHEANAASPPTVILPDSTAGAAAATPSPMAGSGTKDDRADQAAPTRLMARARSLTSALRSWCARSRAASPVVARRVRPPATSSSTRSARALCAVARAALLVARARPKKRFMVSTAATVAAHSRASSGSSSATATTTVLRPMTRCGRATVPPIQIQTRSTS
nr:hypothetical protein [Nonomuraea solani]